ncbi:MAG TPA: hypothetical protein VI758_11010 [Bacteroidota bacterium]
MVHALSFFSQLSDFIVIILCCVVFLFLLKSINLRDKLWLASVAAVGIVALLSIVQIVSYADIAEQLRQKEMTIDTLKNDYARLKSETESARASFTNAKTSIAVSRQELSDLRKKVNTEFERTIKEIRAVYADIADEELDRRFNNAVRKSRQNFQKNIFE